MATKPESLKAHPVTGLVPIRFLGRKVDGKNGPEYVGEAGYGLRVGEIQGVSPEVAARMIDAGTAEAVPPEVDKPAKGKADAA